jgi:hypothetical protein
MKRTITLGLGAALSLGAIAAAATPVFKSESVKIPVPGAYFTGTDATILNQNCVSCHSAGFVDRQPTLAPATWTIEVTKMQKAFGAPYDAAKIPAIVDALVARQKAGS